jgi:hypothetical protein
MNKIYRVIFYANIAIGLAAIMRHVYLFIFSSYNANHLFIIGSILLVIISTSPRFLHAYIKLNYPKKAEQIQIQPEDEKATDIEFICFLITPAMFTMGFSFFLFF